MTPDSGKEQKQRLFVAVALPDAVRSALSGLQKELPGVRWTAPDNLHLTLRFIGNVPLARVGTIKAGLRTVTANVFSLQVNGLGFFHRRPQAVLWAGVETSAELMALKKRIDEALEHHAGLKAAEERFSPHITLARMKQATKQNLSAFTAKGDAMLAETFAVRSFLLFSSVLTPSGALHSVEEEYPLGMMRA